MSRLSSHPEQHLVSRIGWLRAAVLGANDGIVSTASLIIGVAAAAAKPSDILITGVAGLVAGAMSMAAGEYVSVSSQADTEHADLAREKAEIENDAVAEHAELENIYIKRGLTADLAREVATQLMDKDPLAAHAHDELGLVPGMHARPVQAAFTSAATFAIGAAMPLIAASIAPHALLVPIVALASLTFLATLGAIGGRAGGASVGKATLRVSFWGAFAMAATWAVGLLFGTAVA